MRNKKEAKGLRLIIGYFGLFLVVAGLVTIFPLFILAFYPQEWECYMDFLLPGGASIIVGLLLYLLTIAFREKGKLEKNEDSVLLVLLWLAALAIGALPFFLTRYPFLNNDNLDINLDMSYTESFFEATSGYSTTGLTVLPTKVFLTGVDSSDYGWSHVFLFHRAIMHFVGGIGLVLIVASVISSKNNFKLFFAEGHNDRLLPNLGRNAKLILGIYSCWVAVGSLALWLAGMTPFDSFCHSVAALATGGFSTRANSLMFYSSETYMSFSNGNLLYTGNGLAMEIITEVLMIAGATNFVLHTFILTGKLKSFFKDAEVKTSAFIIIVAAILTTLMTFVEHSYYYEGMETISIWTSLRYNLYNIITCITTTGFTNYPSVQYLGHFAIFVALIVMSIGGGMGSTSGGLKQYRLSLLAKEFSATFKNRNASKRYEHSVTVTRLGQTKEVDQESLSEATNYLIVYTSVVLLGGFSLLCLRNINLEEALFEWGVALSSAGITIIDFAAYKVENGLVQYNVLIWLLSLAMFLGRMEIMPLLYAIRGVVQMPFEEMAKHRQKKKIMKNMQEE